jgi:hypothetical protein
LESLRTGIESSFASIEEDPEARVEAAVRAMQDRAAANEGLLRTMIRLTVERRAEEPAGVSPAARGSRRIEWIESALAPVRDELSKGAFSQLVSAISLCVGAEALIVLRDVRGLSPAAAADVSAWSAKALLRAALAEASPSNRARGVSSGSFPSARRAAKLARKRVTYGGGGYRFKESPAPSR